ncbi:MAG: MBL fold metallo-hydrolase [Pseudomonadota bacterium]|nr:MBL fold metallo-hydrolase [Pseudomonadota bacterium]
MKTSQALAVACPFLFAAATAWGQAAPPDNMIDGERFPDGYTPMEIKNSVYPRVYAPNTERLGPKEMRVTALGTGMPNAITGKQKASGCYVELGNGEKFLFDLGSGTMENLAKLRPDWSKVDKVFASHLHSDHVGAFAELYIGGWMNGRHTPLHFYGPSGSEPRLGSKAFVDENVAPTGTTAAYRSAKREPPSVAEKWISPDINAGKWEGYHPAPLPKP